MDTEERERLADLSITDASVNHEQAVEALKALANTDLTNLETGITARINTKQRKKIVSNAAVGKSMHNGFHGKQHNAAATRIDKIFKHASLLETTKDRNGDVNIASIKRFAAPVVIGGETALAYLTVKESVQQEHRIYSLELLEIKKTPPPGNTPFGNATGEVMIEV